MTTHETTQDASTTDGLPVAPSLSPSLNEARIPVERTLVDRRVILIAFVAIGVAIASGFVAQLLTAMIGFVTNLAFYGRFDWSFVSPADNHLGVWVFVIPALGGIVVGIMARYGSRAIRGHGIPEAMEQVITNQSRIPARMTFLKPLSAAIAIGTGGPFGAEGPIIATGGALGSLIGQRMRTSASERKTLLAAGAAAGMAATFGSPVSAVLLAIELLLFELDPRSLIPVSLAAGAAAAVRIAFVGNHPIFPMPDIVQPSSSALALYVVTGCAVGVASVGVTRVVYAIEDAFEKLPIHWMWWPAIGGLVVGAVGYFAPKTLGVGYTNIEQIISGDLALEAIAVLCAAKFVSWAISLGSGTSGGTLAPLFTIGGGMGALIGAGLAAIMPSASIDIRIAALVGMAAMFAGASRAVLASLVFAFETTRQPIGLLPLLGGCTGAYLISCLLMRHSIMTEKIARRGVRVGGAYAADFLDRVLVKERARSPVASLNASDTIGSAALWLASHEPGSRHQGWPVLDSAGLLAGVVTRKDLHTHRADTALPLSTLITKPPIIVFEDSSLREAVEHMVREGVGRLPVVKRDDRRRIVGIITRSDILEAHQRQLDEYAV